MLLLALIANLGLAAEDIYAPFETIEAALEYALDDTAIYQRRLVALNHISHTSLSEPVSHPDDRLLSLDRLTHYDDPAIRLSALMALTSSGHLSYTYSFLNNCQTGIVDWIWSYRWTCLGIVSEAYETGFINITQIHNMYNDIKINNRWDFLSTLSDIEADHTSIIIDALSEAYWLVDWRLTYQAAVLPTYKGRSKPEEVIPLLQAVADYHWLPPVREQAAFAVHLLTTGSETGSDFDWVEYVLQDRAEFERTAGALGYRFVERPIERLFYSRLGSGAFANFPDEWPTCTSGLWTFEDQTFSSVPTNEPGEDYELQILKQGGALFIGTNRGEWGGTLAVQPASRLEVIAPMNVVDLIELDGQILSISGLAHLSSNYGYVDSIKQGHNYGNYYTERILTLPGAPSAAHVLDQNRLGIAGRDWALVFSFTNGVEGLATCTESDLIAE